MHGTTDGWSFPIGLTTALMVIAVTYARGWLHVRRIASTAIPPWRAGSLFLGLVALWVALGSPLAVMDHERLLVHMVEHVLVASVAPPLIWLGLPVLPLWLGVPRRLGRRAHAAIASGAFRPFRILVEHPITPWIVATLTILAWHIPAAFEMAQQSQSWHWIQRATFFATGLLFWWPVVRPWSTVALPRFAIPLYLFAATLPCDALSAFLVFCDRAVYRQYQVAPHVVTPALEDQQAAGAFMWVSITLIYVLPAIVLTVRALSPARRRGENRLTDRSSTWSRATARP